MKIKELINELNDMLLLYGDKTILTITDSQNEYDIKSVCGTQCAKYFQPTDNVAEVTIEIKRR